jgi:hypothetical protein
MIGASEKQQMYIDYAWEISGDSTFIYLLKAENGEISHDRKHPGGYIPKGQKKRYYDWGFCGMSGFNKSKIVNDKRFLSDWKWQMEQCHKEYKAGTTFYGIKKFDRNPKFRATIINSFNWK